VAEGAFEFAPGWSFADPWLLLFAPVAWLCLWRGRGESGRAEARATLVERVPASWRSNTRFVPFVLSALAAACVAVALARPLRGEVRSDSESEGVDIALVVDRSGSMQDKEGAADQCALIVFAAYPQILCPYTLDVDAIRGFIEELQPVQNRQEDGTGIGVGLAKAVQTLAGSEAKSKVAVLLTDGENNLDSIAPLEAADLAAKSGVKVYTIFAGRYAYAFDAFGRAVPTRRETDTTELRRIAERTGGLHFRARDQAELERAYAQIESLERTKRVVSRRVENYDAYKALLLPALLLQLLAFLGWRTIWRTLP
jgi:Ca-activated chloride channel family protein